MESIKGRRSVTSRYLAALLAPAVVAGVMLATWPLSHDNPVLPYLLAVIFCAWYGRLGPGLLSLLVSFLLTDYFFIELTISDNGRGITEEEKSRSQSLGLLGMQERAHLAGGNIDVNGVAGKGTVVTVRIPTGG